jgi:2-C-methyl-D-erythritol 2,4-cyclodiphosphate synthase
MNETRTGLGIDLHRFDARRPLYLGGVLFEGEPGLAGHSDGDVVCHALADALLGAASLGDLGQHFPDTDPAYQGIAGLDLLARVIALLAVRGLVPTDCDLTILADRPHIADRRAEIRRALAGVLEVSEDKVSVKASRPEGLGLSGDGAGCFAIATVARVMGG